MPLTLTPSGGSPTTFLDPVDGFTRITGNYYVHGGAADEPEYRVIDTPAPNVDGYAVKRDGFGGRDIKQIEVAYIAATKQACNTAFATDQTNICNKQLSVVVPNDGTYPACDLVSFKRMHPEPRDGGHGRFRLHCIIELRQKRLT